MLDFKQNRLTYRELLAPPEGYTLTRAVGTTYSLDLYALLAVPVALFYQQSLQDNFKPERYEVLEAIRKSRERVTLFCQRGKINLPEGFTSLLSLIEQRIVEVQPSEIHSSFHPKIWVLRFEKKKQVYYRLAVLSRNLTFDRSWDIATFIDGKPSRENSANGKFLGDFLSYLFKSTKTETDARFIRDLSKIEFNVPEGFQSPELFPIVGKKQSAGFANPVLSCSYQKLLVMTPFSDADTIAELKKNNKHITLLSRKDELDAMPPATFNDMDVFYFNEVIRDAERTMDSEGGRVLSQDLHAKLFIGANKRKTEWLLGSANGTSAAMSKNVEFMVKFAAKSSQASFDVIKNALTNQDLGIFRPYLPGNEFIEPKDKRKEYFLRKITFQLGESVFKASVRQRNDQDTFDLQLEVDLGHIQSIDGLVLNVALLNRVDALRDLHAGKENSLIFENIALTRLSCFVALGIEIDGITESRLVFKAELAGMPLNREDAIFSDLINNKKSFYQYLQFILEPEGYDGLLEIIREDIEKNASGISVGAELSPPIYENLLIAASRSRFKLTEINQIMIRLEKLNSNVVADFKPIWDIFKKFADD
jgi:hypothetical protein